MPDSPSINGRNDVATGDTARLKVALMVRRFVPSAGGLESWAHDLAKMLLARGCRVRVLTTVAEAALPGLDVTIVPAVTDALEQARLFAAAAATLHGEILHDTGVGLSSHVFQPQMGCQALNLSRDLATLPLRRRLRLARSLGFHRAMRAARQFEAMQLASARRVIAVSDETAVAFRKRYGITPERIVIIPNGIDTERFNPLGARAARAAMRHALGIPDGTRVLLAAAANFRLKGVRYAIEAMAAPELDDALLLVAGDGDIEEYAAQARQNRVAERVRFLGRVEDMPSLYGAADIFVHPTAHDACSLATLEAMSSGLAVVTTRFNGAADGMRQGREGIVLDRLSTRSLVRALADMRDPVRRAAMGQEARKLAERHAFGDTVDRLVSVYRALHSQSPLRA